MANPSKTQYINSGRALSTRLVAALDDAASFNIDLNKLGYIDGGSDPITQDDLDAAMSGVYPGAAGSIKLDDWNAGVYAIGKNGQDYRGGEDTALLKIKS